MDETRPSKRPKTVSDETKHVESGSRTRESSSQDVQKQKRKWHREKVVNSQKQKSRESVESQDGPSSQDVNPMFTNTQQRSKAGKKKTFSQPSILQTGDKGIFVTCDKGREKQSLLELLDLVEQYAEQQQQDGNTKASLQRASSGAETGGSQEPSATNDRAEAEAEDFDVEASIMAELAAMQHHQQQPITPPDTSQTLSSGAPVAAAVDLITLDVPCVSFLRLPRQSPLDPVDLVHRICADAAAHPARPRSRYVKRLTPVTRLAKVLSRGLESLCDDVLPRFFQFQDDDDHPPSTTTGNNVLVGLKYAIRPSIRNNDKINRDQIIQIVGDRVQALGKGKHKVDLKGYEAGILVEVYRGWVGVCVVGNGGDGKIVPLVSEMGYERLKRFNLAEIYAAGRQKESME